MPVLLSWLAVSQASSCLLLCEVIEMQHRARWRAHTDTVTDTWARDWAISSAKDWEAWHPAGWAATLPSPFTAEDKRHEPGPSPESPLPFTAVILPQSPSAPPPAVPIPKPGKQSSREKSTGGFGRRIPTRWSPLCDSMYEAAPCQNFQWIQDSIQTLIEACIEYKVTTREVCAKFKAIKMYHHPVSPDLCFCSEGQQLRKYSNCSKCSLSLQPLENTQVFKHSVYYSRAQDVLLWAGGDLLRSRD